MYEVILNVSFQNDTPKIDIEAIDKSNVKERIAKEQIRQGLGDVFLSDLTTDKDTLDKTHGFYITRNISTNKRTFENSFVRLSSLNQDGKLSLSFLDDENIINFDMPSILSLARTYNTISYNVSYFNFPSNLINKSNIKIEESIIYNYYKKYKKTLSPAITKKIASDIKSNSQINDLPKVFYDAYSISSSEKLLSSNESLNLNKALNINFANRLFFNQKSYICELFSSDIDNIEIDLKSLKVVNNKSVLREVLYEKNKIKPHKNGNFLYFNILSKQTYKSIKSITENFEVKIFYRVYNSNNGNIISTKELSFYF